MPSSCIATGYFALSNGVRLQAPVTSTTTYPVHHVYYDTLVRTVSGSFLPARLRNYSGPSDQPLPDSTVAFAIAKAYAPAGDEAVIELDALYFSAVPGNPFANGYQDPIPDCATFFTGVGNVPSTMNIPPGIKACSVSLAEHVFGTVKTFELLCIFPATARWRNTRAPGALSCFGFLGQSAGRTPEGVLQIHMEHLTPNLGPTPAAHLMAIAASATSVPTSPNVKYPTATSASVSPAHAQPVASTSRAVMQPAMSLPVPKDPRTPTPKSRKRAKQVPVIMPTEDDDEIEEEEEEEEEEPEPEPEEEPRGKGKRKRRPRAPGA
ncbi:hypothetical protein C8F01DRAFT_1263819 [Mycena amicta]|nr:hypothetical protein C8F01DRAFT_1263819 [Mycena amicta]